MPAIQSQTGESGRLGVGRPFGSGRGGGALLGSFTYQQLEHLPPIVSVSLPQPSHSVSCPMLMTSAACYATWNPPRWRRGGITGDPSPRPYDPARCRSCLRFLSGVQPARPLPGGLAHLTHRFPGQQSCVTTALGDAGGDGAPCCGADRGWLASGCVGGMPAFLPLGPEVRSRCLS